MSHFGGHLSWPRDMQWLGWGGSIFRGTGLGWKVGRADSWWNVVIGPTVLLMFMESDRKSPTSTRRAIWKERKKMAHLPALSSLVYVPLVHP